MKIGIGLPASVPGVKGTDLVEWARRADKASFSSLGIIDRLVFSNYEPLTTLAAAAGATQRIRLMTTVLLAPIRDTAMLAKQAASLDALSGGRLTLGLGIGAREDDFRATNAAFNTRGKRLTEQVTLMKRLWSGQAMAEGVGPIGPQPVRPGGPELLIGGSTPAALRRSGRLGDGYVSGGGGDPRQTRANFEIVEQAWKEAGRAGQPRFVACVYTALGKDAAEQASAYIHSYYGNMPWADNLVRASLTSEAAIQDRLRAFQDAGADEVILWPTAPGLEQVSLLADAAAKF